MKKRRREILNALVLGELEKKEKSEKQKRNSKNI